jgi:hypothetical protein
LSATDTNERIWTEGVTAPRVILLFLERSFEPPADDACSTGARGAIILQVLLQNLNPGQDTREQATTYLELYSKCHSCKAHRTTVLRSVGARSSKCCRASFSDFRSRVKGGASQSHLTVRRATYLDGLSSTVVNAYGISRRPDRGGNCVAVWCVDCYYRYCSYLLKPSHTGDGATQTARAPRPRSLYILHSLHVHYMVHAHAHTHTPACQPPLSHYPVRRMSYVHCKMNAPHDVHHDSFGSQSATSRKAAALPRASRSTLTRGVRNRPRAKYLRLNAS